MRRELQKKVDLQQVHIDQLILLASEYQNIRLKMSTDARTLGRVCSHSAALSFDDKDINLCMGRIDRSFMHLELMINHLNQKIRTMDADNYGC